MILGVGTDIVDARRIGKSIDQFADKFTTGFLPPQNVLPPPLPANHRPILPKDLPPKKLL